MIYSLVKEKFHCTVKIESLSSSILLVQSDDKVGRICSRLCQFISRSPSHELYVHAIYVSEGSSNKRPYPSIGPYLYGHSVSFNLNSSWIWPCFKICILSTRILNDSKADVLILIHVELQLAYNVINWSDAIKSKWIERLAIFFCRQRKSALQSVFSKSFQTWFCWGRWHCDGRSHDQVWTIYRVA